MTPGRKTTSSKPLPPLIFPEQLFLAQLTVSVIIAPFGMGFERRLLGDDRPTAERGHAVDSE